MSKRMFSSGIEAGGGDALRNSISLNSLSGLCLRAFSSPRNASSVHSAPRTEHESSRKSRVMICDDHEDILYVCATYLRRSYDVIVAKSGRECLSMFVEAQKNGEPIEVLLLDYRLGDMSGEDVIRDLSTRELCGRTRIVLITAAELGETTLLRLRRACGKMPGELRKPFSIRELGDKVAATLAQECVPT